MAEDKTLETVDIPGIEVFATGTFNGDTYSDADLQKMVDAFGRAGFQPTVKAGHADGQESEKKARQVFGAPALGYVGKLYVQGKKLLGDLVGVPRRFADLVKAGAYKRISAEIYWNYKDDAKKETYPRVLKSVAFLGADIPALTDLKAVEALYDMNENGCLIAYDDKKNEFRAYQMEAAMPIGVSPYDLPRFLIGLRRKEKADVNFTDLADQNSQCQDCVYYLDVCNACSLVEGYIEPDDGCDLFEADGGNYQRYAADDLPLKIEKQGDKFCVLQKSDGKVIGCKDNMAEAMKLLGEEHKKMAAKDGVFSVYKAYPWDQCISDQKDAGYSEEQANRICAAIKNRTVSHAMKTGLAKTEKEAVDMIAKKMSEDTLYEYAWGKFLQQRPVVNAKVYMDQDEVGKICPPCAETMKQKGITKLIFSAEEAASIFQSMDMATCMANAAMKKKYPEMDKLKKACEDQMAAAMQAAIGDKQYQEDVMDEKEKQGLQAEVDELKKQLEAKQGEIKKFSDEAAEAQRAAKEKEEAEKKLAERVATLEKEKRSERIDRWITDEKRGGRLTPKEEPKARALLESLDETRIAAYSQDGKETKESVADIFKSFITTRPSIFQELSHSSHEENGTQLEDAGAEVDRRAKEYQQKNAGTDYAKALSAVLNADPQLAERYNTMQKQ